MNPNLTPRHTPGASVQKTTEGWRLDIPSGPGRAYRLAQVDDYISLPRRAFPWNPPLKISLRARLSASNLPGTWGFGLWNDPFGLAIGFGGTARRLPALPNAAWFFHASQENHLSLGDAPANGFFAGTFRSPRLPSPLLAPALPALPFLALHPVSRWLRRIAGRIVQQDGRAVGVDVTQWHTYFIHWQPEAVTFLVDGAELLRTPLSPRAPLGLVIWMDNQYAAWRPDGSLGYGTLANPSAWMEVEWMESSPADCPRQQSTLSR
jgi:hypothetical protein